MIILDTCVIRGMRLDGSDVEVLRAIVATGTDRVSAPSVAVEELAAQKALEYVEAHRLAARHLRQLANKSHRAEPKLKEPDPEGVRQMWRERYGFLQVLPTSGAAAIEGLYREANVLPPAGTKGDGDKKVKVGARDVAIWLTAVEYAREHPDEKVYFVSSNHKDFTKGGAGYPPPMDSDVEGFGDRFVHLTNLAELLESLAPKVEVNAADVHGLLEQHMEWFTGHLRLRLTTGSPIDVRSRAGEIVTARAWAFPKDLLVRLVDIRDVNAYRLGAYSWVVATARWEFAGLAVGKTMFQGAGTTETRILFPTRSGGEHKPRIIKSYGMFPVEDASAVDWPPPMEGSEYMRRILAAVEAEGRKPTWAEVLLAGLAALPLMQQNSGADLSRYAAYQPTPFTLYPHPPLGAAEAPPEDEPFDEE